LPRPPRRCLTPDRNQVPPRALDTEMALFHAAEYVNFLKEVSPEVSLLSFRSALLAFAFREIVLTFCLLLQNKDAYRDEQVQYSVGARFERPFAHFLLTSCARLAHF
jgi:hypothetical protein